MKATTELFDLIKNLDGGEKGYFKKHSFINSRSNADVNYLMLFDSIEAQEKYDEKELRLKFKQHAFAKQFPVAKTYLYNRILKALHSYHSSVFEDIRNYLHYAEILYYKKLYDQSAKALDKAKKLSLRYDIHHYYPAILAWESNLAVATYDLNWVDEIISESNKEMLQLQNNQGYNMLVMNVMVIINRYGSIRKKNLLEKLEQTMKNPALRNETNAIGFTSKMNFFAIHAFYQYAKENYSLAEKYFKRQLALFRNNPEKTKAQFTANVVCINNLIGMLFQEGADRSEAPAYLALLKAEMLQKRKPSQQALLFYLYNQNLLMYMHVTGQFDKATELLPDILRDYPKHGKELNPFQKTSLLIKISITWFGAEQYGKCLQYLNMIRNQISFKVQPDMDYFLYVFYIIVHYEAGHYDLLSSLIQSAEYFSKKQNSQSKLEDTLLQFFKKNRSKTSGKISSEEFVKLKEDVLFLSKDRNEKHSFENFNFIDWIESKIENKKIGEIIKQKAKQ